MEDTITAKLEALRAEGRPYPDTLLSTRLRLNHFWPNSYSVSQIGGRSFEGVGWIPALFSGSVALAQSNIPRSPIHAQFCNTEHREPGQDQAQLGHRQGGCQGLVFNLRPAQHLPAESTPSKEGWHLVSIMIRCYDLCFLLFSSGMLTSAWLGFCRCYLTKMQKWKCKFLYCARTRLTSWVIQ